MTEIVNLGGCTCVIRELPLFDLSLQSWLGAHQGVGLALSDPGGVNVV